MSTATRTSRKSSGQRCHRGVELAGLDRSVRLARLRVGDEVELLGQRAGAQPAALGSLLGQEGVAQRTEEVAEVVLVAEQPGSPEHARVGLLDEVLGVLAGAAERPGGPVEPVYVISEPSRVEWALHLRGGLRRPVRPVSIDRE